MLHLPSAAFAALFYNETSYKWAASAKKKTLDQPISVYLRRTLYFNYKCKDVEVIQLKRNLQDDLQNLSKCDVVIHMAEKNRGVESELYVNNTQSALDLTIA